MSARVVAMILLMLGTTALVLAHYGPGAPIFAFCKKEPNRPHERNIICA